MKMLSLFSGIGGLDLAAQWVGIETVAFCEIDPFCQNVLNKHWPGVMIFDDVTKLSASSIQNAGISTESIDIITGGFPCQPHSISGLRWHLMTAVICGAKIGDSLAKLSPNGTWEKMYQGYFQANLDGSLVEFLETWPDWGIMSDGVVSELKTPDLSKGGEGFLLWPRPMASDWKRNYRDSEKLKRYMKKGHQLCWPDIVQLDALIKEEFGQPHPEFGEWLMGFPIGWTDLDQ